MTVVFLLASTKFLPEPISGKCVHLNFWGVHPYSSSSSSISMAAAITYGYIACYLWKSLIDFLLN